MTRAREHIPVEIALLVSLLLHVTAFITWQHRATLSSLPLFSSVMKLLRAPTSTFTASHPQTITFVEVEEPRGKERQKQPEKETESARRFMETDASQVTGEKPKEAKYYSDKSTVAANPKNPTGKEGETPYLEGTETRAPSSVDVPTPSGVPQPLVVQHGAPGAVVSAAKAAPPPSQVVRPARAQPKTPEQPKEVAAQGLKIVEEQPLAMASKPAAPEVMTGGSGAEPGAAGAPTIISEPGTPGRELVAHKESLKATGISRKGIAAFNVAESPFGAYDKKVIHAVQSRWYALIDRFGMYERAGQVTVHFEMLDDGQVQNLEITDNTAGQILALFCEKAIIESGPFDPLPDNLRALVGKEPREASFTFYY
ncbi:MAG TPA: hypothetical protein VL171_18035 [Verrucomicrobiae bacterium]|nr:hypothetical protein [Verrucomicrobiae bacterium]